MYLIFWQSDKKHTNGQFISYIQWAKSVYPSEELSWMTGAGWIQVYSIINHSNSILHCQNQNMNVWAKKTALFIQLYYKIILLKQWSWNISFFNANISFFILNLLCKNVVEEMKIVKLKWLWRLKFENENLYYENLCRGVESERSAFKRPPYPVPHLYNRLAAQGYISHC